MRRWLVPALALGAALGAVLTGGAEPFGRLALRVYAPGLAEPMVADPALKGLALARQGRHGEAADAFAGAGPNETYNRATAHALNGDFAEALLSYDDLLVREPDHADAIANFRLIASVYGGTKLDLSRMDLLIEEQGDGPIVEGPEAQGGGRAMGTGADSDGLATDIFAPNITVEAGLRRTSRIFDDKFIDANAEWLTTMLDQPGLFLSERLKAEQKRRQELGIGVETEEGAW